MLYYRQDSRYITLSGQTYPHRQAIKALGGSFVGGRKVWQVPLEALNQVQELCSSVGGGALDGGGLTAPGSAQPEDTAPPTDGADPFGFAAEVQKKAVEPAKEAPAVTVSQLMERVGAVIGDAFADWVWVVGEVQNLGVRPRGTFLNLVEGAGAGGAGTVSVSAVIWSNVWNELSRRLGTDTLASVLQEGLQVRCLCRVEFYRGRGQISLAVLDIDPQFTHGALALARAKLLKELRASGLATANRERPWPLWPERVGLITAPGSRALSDFTHQLTQGSYPGTVVFAPAPMQGEATLQQVERALDALQQTGCDTIVLTRGGGSTADLRWFDQPAIAYAIARCQVPVIAAIGHHDDRSVAEEISAALAKTPTAAAEDILERVRQVRQKLEQASLTLIAGLRTAFEQRETALRRREVAFTQSARHGLERRGEIISRAREELARRASQACERAGDSLERARRTLQWRSGQALTAGNEAIGRAAARLERQAREQHLAATHLLAQREATLAGLDPRPRMAAGWTRLQGADGVITAIDEIKTKPGTTLQAVLAGGRLEMTVTAVKKTPTPTRT